MIKIGSLFSGIGGFELGLERALPQSKTIWQVEQNVFCQSILRKHWADATIHDDICTVGAHNLKPVDVLCGGFPCQDISIAGKQKGINNGKKSSLYYEMFRIICEIRPRVVVFENVSAIIRLGGHDVLRTLADAGYDAEWCVIRTGADFGLPHIRRRWFCVAYSTSIGHKTSKNSTLRFRGTEKRVCTGSTCSSPQNSDRTKPNCDLSTVEHDTHRGDKTWCTVDPIICRGDHGFPSGLDKTTIREHNQRLKALGNAITPQSSEWIGRQILQSGLLDDLL